ncbi:ankyrin repeat-containing protein [Cavenderia fasciculata]|uniref:Ankyrin repeat-containing protein n=1 Tax=Cavenderia fasciculata TaxID=261658 RepID=F4QEU3_CACFS|nr:ankyrin repeat-containing protein [Cavenderia fasciculata]EGG14150.1 ankyrin repeat-containing protein [Cavenderia fasciculata]|eukprot:XP_004350858.1 ankyrin repeat-containing protein [Cavenderia fasciculata]
MESFYHEDLYTPIERIDIEELTSRENFVWSSASIYSISHDLEKTNDKQKIVQYLTKLDTDGQTLLHSQAMGTIRPNQHNILINTLKHLNKTEYLEFKNVLNRAEETALHVAVLNKNYAFLRLFATCGPNASYKCHRNLTPLDMAVWMDDFQAAEIIAAISTSQLTVELPKNFSIKGHHNASPNTENPISPFYQWGQMFTTQLSLGKVSTPQTVLFNHHQEHGVSNVQFGGNFALMLTDTGMIYSWGLCSYGKLGQYSKNDCPIPSQIMELKNKQITQIACGKDHSLALDEIGCVYAWGNGAGGRLGLNKTDVVSLPTMVAHFPDQVKVVGIACGQDHSMAVCQDGRVFSWGQAGFGKLGYSNPMGFQSTPRRVESIPACKQVSCGNWHSLTLTNGGDVYAFGSNREGRCGRELTTVESPPNRVIFDANIKIKKIGAGLNFNAVLTTSNMIYTWGNNDKGQLGVLIETKSNSTNNSRNNNNNNNYISVYAATLNDTYTYVPQLVKTLLPYPINNIEVGYEHVVVLTDAGEVITFGSNQMDQLGHGELLRDAGTFRKVEIQNKSTVFKIAAGNYASLVSLSSGHSIFGSEMAQLLKDERYYDLCLQVNSNRQETVKAHRFIVASRSKKLHSLLKMEIDRPNQNNKIPLTQTTFITTSTENGIIYMDFPSFTSIEPIKLFVKFLYTDHAPLVASHVQDLGILATSLSIERLSYICNITNYKSLETIPTSSLLEDFGNLSNQEYLDHYGDITFNVSSEKSSYQPINSIQKIKSYRAMLALRSQYFQMMFQGQFAESTKNEIDMYEVDPGSFNHLLVYLYCNSVPEDPNQCIDLLFLADIHQIPRAKELLAAVIRPSIDVESICSIYHLAIKLNVKPLVVWCEAKIPTMPNPQQLPEYDLLPDTVKSIIEKKLDQLNEKLNQLSIQHRQQNLNLQQQQEQQQQNTSANARGVGALNLQHYMHWCRQCSMHATSSNARQDVNSIYDSNFTRYISLQFLKMDQLVSNQLILYLKYNMA